MDEHLFSDEQIDIINFCAEECYRQQSGEISVYDMINAWHVADDRYQDDNNQLTLADIVGFGFLVEPIDNSRGFRTVPVYIGWEVRDKKLPEIKQQITNLLEAWNEGRMTDPDDFYEEFEFIHPFVDGNGRTGKILYNYIKGTLRSPVMPLNRKDGQFRELA